MFGVLGLLAGVLLGCEGNDNPEVTQRPDAGDGAAGTGGTGSNGDGGDADSQPTDASEEFVLPEASSVVVRVGVLPVAASADGGPTQANETLAHLEIVAAGSRASTIVRRWDDLFTSATLPEPAAWQYLGGISKLYADAGRSVLVSLAVVDRTLDARPSGVTGTWSSATTISAGHALVDRTFATFGAELAYLAIGNEVDRFLALAPTAEREAFVTFAKSVIDYARAHPSLPPGAKIGVSATTDALTQPSPELAELIAASDVPIASYHAVDASFVARPASAAASDLDALWAAIGGDGGSKEIVLSEVAYPSSSESGSSLEQQRAFFDGLFVALLSRRERFPFVVVRGSHEEPAEVCDAHAVAIGAPGSPAASAAYCSFGLRAAAGDDKPAWGSVVDGLATFSSP
jgi:hypothetical protein